MTHAPIDAERYQEMLSALGRCPDRRTFDACFLMYFVNVRYPRLDLQDAAVAVLKAKGWEIDPGGNNQQEDL